MDYEAMAAGYQQAIPFNNHLGIEVTELAPGRGVVRLPDDPSLHNHVASQHAGGLFTAGEAASGGAMLATLGDLMAEATPLAEGAEISYRKIARGPITATGRFTMEREAIVEELGREGRVRFPVEVELTDGEGNVVAEMTVRWYLRRNKA